MVMGLFAIFWTSFGLIQLPTLTLGQPFATSTDPTGTLAPAYNADIALFLIVWSVPRHILLCPLSLSRLRNVYCARDQGFPRGF